MQQIMEEHKKEKEFFYFIYKNESKFGKEMDLKYSKINLLITII